jgi:hypothetical protein
MRLSQLPVIGLILALFFGARTALPGSQPSSSGTGARTQREKQKVDKSIPREVPAVWEALCKLNPEYGSTWYLSDRAELETSTSRVPDPPCLRDEKKKNLELDIFWVIAAVPDPVHTHLGLSFDRTIDAIQTAASEADTPYFPYLNALPWPPPQEKSDASGKETASDYQYPGVLVFRRLESHPDDSRDKHDRPGPRYLAVFLVPELPTSGIDRPTFLAAARIMYQISPNSARTIALLGPNFSGSVGLLGELRSQLNAQLKSQFKKNKTQDQNQWCIQAVSGSVTNPGDDPFPDEKGSRGCISTFTTLQTSDREAKASFISAMGSSGSYCPGEIAILTEDGTEYGNSPTQDEKPKPESGNSPAPDEKSKPQSGNSPPPDEKSKSESGCEHKKSALYLHFPREISKLRNAYGPSITQQSQKERAQAASSPALSLTWQDAHPFIRDDVRNYGEQTAVSEETVLASLATTIKSQRIKALGILATDPLDTAFLIHSFKNSSPDVRLFLRDPDLLYLRTPDLGSTNGIMVINNFPLVAQNQFWRKESKDENHLILLPSAQQEATHSAFLLLLSYKLSPPAMFKPLDGEWPAEPSRSFDDWMRDKPLWLGVTGTAGYYPVRLLNKKEDISAHEKIAELHSLKAGRPPFVTMLLLILISLVGMFHAYWATFPSTAPSRFEQEFDFSNKADTITVAKGMCHALALLSLTLGCLLLGSSFCFFRHTAYSVWRIPVYLGGAILTLALTFTLVVAAAWRLVDSVLRPWQAFQRGAVFLNGDVINLVKLVRSIPLAVAIFVGPIVYWLVATSKSTYENAFLHYRDLYLASGVAPALPGLVLVAIAYLGVLGYLRRVSYWEYGSVITPPLPLDDTFPCDFSASVRRVDAWMLGVPAASAKRILLYLVFFAGSVAALRPWATMDGIEGQEVNRFLVAGFTFAFFIISVNWIRFTAIWRELRTILRGLEKLPLRLAFDRLPRESSLPIWSWSIHDGTFLPIVQAVDTLRALVRADPGAISPESQRKLKSGTIALNNPEHRQTLQELQELAQEQENVEKQALNFIVREREHVMSFQEAPAYPMTSEGSIPVPLRRTESGRTPTRGPNMGKLTPFPSGPSDARATGVSAKTTLSKQKQILRETRQVMTEVIRELSRRLLREYWCRGGVGLCTDPSKVDPADRKYLLAEDLVALRFYSYIRYVVCELRNLMFLLALSFSLLYLSLHVYSFRAGQAIEWSFIVLFLVMGGGVFWVLLQMERDALLSRLEGTTAGQLNKQFYINLLKYGVVPLLTVFGSHVPAVSNFLLTKLQPTLEVFR